MATKKNLSYICLYYDYLCMFDRLSDKELGEVIYALIDYMESGKTPEFKGGMRGAFTNIMYRIKLDGRKYQERCGKNRGKKNDA